jgi:hypothetical protein
MQSCATRIVEQGVHGDRRIQPMARELLVQQAVDPKAPIHEIASHRLRPVTSFAQGFQMQDRRNGFRAGYDREVRSAPRNFFAQLADQLLIALPTRHRENRTTWIRANAIGD